MSQASLEERIQTLEEQVRELMDRLNNQHRLPNWQATVGTMTWDELSQTVEAEIQQEREADRERGRRDHP